MSIAASIKRYLDHRRIFYKLHALPAADSFLRATQKIHVPTNALVQGTVLCDRFGLVLAITSTDRSLDLDALSRLMGRTFERASTAQIRAVFKDCDIEHIAPLGEPYGVRAIIDDSLVDLTDVYFVAGTKTHIIHTNSKNFFQLQGNAWLGHGFTVVNPQTELAQLGQEELVNVAIATPSPPDINPMIDLRKQIARLDELPSMPDMAQQIYQLSTDPSSDATKLADVIQIDPSLAAQIMRYAGSPFFGYRGKIDSIHTAISRVLGYDMVMNLALGLATAKPFKIQRSGPLGLDGFWRHATYSAALVQTLGAQLPAAMRPSPGLAYLAGLLHNFGHLLIGHLQKTEFAELNNMIIASPNTPVLQFEQQVFGSNHAEFGAWLLEKWKLPDEIIVAMREHHNEHYTGEHKIYAQLVMIADRILKSHGMGDAPNGNLPTEILHELKLKEVQILLVVNRVLEDCEGLNTMAQQLAA